MKKIVLYVHIALLLTAAGALIHLFRKRRQNRYALQITFWLVVVSSALGIINYRQTVK